MKNFKLDENNDLFFNGNFAFAENDQELIQNIKQKYATMLDEFKYDRTIGIPFSLIMQPYIKDHIKRQWFKRILDTHPRVASVDSFSYRKDEATGEAFINFKITSVEGVSFTGVIEQ